MSSSVKSTICSVWTTRTGRWTSTACPPVCTRLLKRSCRKSARLKNNAPLHSDKRIHGKIPGSKGFRGFLMHLESRSALAELRSAAGGLEAVLLKVAGLRPLDFTGFFEGSWIFNPQINPYYFRRFNHRQPYY